MEAAAAEGRGRIARLEVVVEDLEGLVDRTGDGVADVGEVVAEAGLEGGQLGVAGSTLGRFLIRSQFSDNLGGWICLTASFLATELLAPAFM